LIPIIQMNNIPWKRSRSLFHGIVTCHWNDREQWTWFCMGLLIVECDNDSCPTRVHVNRPKWGTKWMEIGFMPHTCVTTNTRPYKCRARPCLKK
jgi:hypothetical protein